MDVIADTDVVSTFGKIKRLGLLKQLFRKSKLYISLQCRREIANAKKSGYEFADYILKQKFVNAIVPSKEELRRTEKLENQKHSLSLADAELLILSKNRSLVALTNDEKLIKEIKKKSVKYFNLPMILRELWKQNIVSKNEVRELIKDIERNDRIRIVNKNLIFEE